MRRSIVIGLALLAVGFLFVGGPSLLVGSSAEEVAPSQTESPELVEFEDSESGFWEYLSAREAHDRRSPINVVVRGDAEQVVRMMQLADEDWEETDEEHEDADQFTYSIGGDNQTAEENASHTALPTEIPWGEAAGTTRYAYVDLGPGEETRWTTETLQLDDGDYYGQRYHIRLYESPNPDDEWVAMQAHTEHFDWFTLRHRVDGVEAAQSRVERDLMSMSSVDPQEDVQRIYLGNSRPSDSDGWATKVDLRAASFVPVVVGLAARGKTRTRVEDGVDRYLTDADRERLAAARDRFEPRHIALAGTIVGLFLGVRMAGIVLENAVDALTMHMIAGLLYPVIAVVIPLATYAIASGLERRLDAALVAATSLAVAIWIDYGWLGVDRLPLDVVLQRILVVVALGLIAAGAARRATRERRLNGLLLVGLATWTLVLVGTLFGYL
ncbi:hypothetical protein [Halovivax sp.]|uniref:hypothetical protein n=1 Tax=Halovivax sp. TaxID=1935978 RepID=UPI0025BC7205|nr:hypothetical protein [Halovivax sp.]